ncbi:MAG: DNA polymerase IV [Gammaproteobacteria bacterium]|nr:DNA polymerase IV [Gammaproteobacteria bacterium]MBT8111327.1 DNA polymerase IV [Gammaproteobacteria bacterium]NND46086.1 DNA polymerase IV [Woeseiaceae bacterium]NNL46025.1 DNA polymerase IV [Woeseiaceae bacterium]
MPAPKRSILHVDMDAFYASVEQRDDPELRGKPLVVGGSANRGVVAAASYEARTFGIRSAMPMAEAMRRCPELCRVRPRMSHYRSVSEQIFAIFREFTPVVEGLSLDEAFLDVTASVALFGAPAEIAIAIKRRILDETRLTASVGVAENKLVAKIASDLDKPDALTVIWPGDYEARLDPLPVAVIPGIGRKTLARLSTAGIGTVRDLRLADDCVLEPIFGRFTRKTRDRASGLDDRPVVSSRAEKSISAEETFDRDLASREQMNRELLRLSERTAGRLRKAGLAAGTVHIKVRRSDFRTFTRQRSVKPPANGTDQLYAIACALLNIWLGRNPGAKIRLLGVGGSNLAPAEQPDLFAAAADEPALPIDQAVDEIRDRFGSTSVGRARTLDGQ